ncbi:MAG: RNA pseudouridine synthase [Spirochaetales bacterium]|nr:RNA pseudouridine synthase [Spirochaetales bacterium]
MTDDRVLYIDNHLIIVNKLPGELTQGDETGDRTLADDVKDYLKARFNKPGNVFLGIVHRLDRPTSGVVIYARTDKALGRMSALFRDGGVSKTYWAVTDALPPEQEGRLTDFLVRDSSKNKSFVVAPGTPSAREARLRYRVLGSSDRYHLLEIVLQTGRHHQIRAQLAHLGIHIKGDLKYGARRSDPDGGIHLHARRVSFVHPVSGENVDVTAPVPDDPVWKYFENSCR